MRRAGERIHGRCRRSCHRTLGFALFLALAALAATVAPPFAAATDAPPPHAPSAIIIDLVTGRVLYGKDVHHERPMASTTKIMTALLVVQRCPNLSRLITAPPRVVNESGIGLRPGERISVRQALLALMIRSAQDAGVTLATAVAGDEEAFVAMMNAKAHSLGLDDTHYTNACGNIPDASHHSSVYDLAGLARLAMGNPRFRDLVWRQHAVIHWGAGRELAVRSNNLLLHWSWADGVKPGFTGPARYCLVGSGQPGLRPFITATLGAPNRDQDARDHVALFKWASALYEEKAVVNAGDAVAGVPLAGGGEVQVAAKTTLTAVVRSDAALRPTFTLPQQFDAQPADGTVVGSVVYRTDGVRLGTVKLVVVTPPSPSPAPTGAAPQAPAGTGSPAPAGD